MNESAFDNNNQQLFEYSGSFNENTNPYMSNLNSNEQNKSLLDQSDITNRANRINSNDSLAKEEPAIQSAVYYPKPSNITGLDFETKSILLFIGILLLILVISTTLKSKDILKNLQKKKENKNKQFLALEGSVTKEKVFDV